jgi:hypothetical protein
MSDQEFRGAALKYRLLMEPFIESCMIVDNPRCAQSLLRAHSEVVQYRGLSITLNGGDDMSKLRGNEVVDSASFTLKCRQEFHQRAVMGYPMVVADWNTPVDFVCIECGVAQVACKRVVIPVARPTESMYTVARYFGCSFQCVRAYLARKMRFLDQSSFLLLSCFVAEHIIGASLESSLTGGVWSYSPDCSSHMSVQQVMYILEDPNQPYTLQDAVADRRLPPGCKDHLDVHSVRSHFDDDDDADDADADDDVFMSVVREMNV